MTLSTDWGPSGLNQIVNSQRKTIFVADGISETNKVVNIHETQINLINQKIQGLSQSNQTSLNRIVNCENNIQQLNQSNQANASTLGNHGNQIASINQTMKDHGDQMGSVHQKVTNLMNQMNMESNVRATLEKNTNSILQDLKTNVNDLQQSSRLQQTHQENLKIDLFNTKKGIDDLQNQLIPQILQTVNWLKAEMAEEKNKNGHLEEKINEQTRVLAGALEKEKIEHQSTKELLISLSATVSKLEQQFLIFQERSKVIEEENAAVIQELRSEIAQLKAANVGLSSEIKKAHRLSGEVFTSRKLDESPRQEGKKQTISKLTKKFSLNNF